MGDPWVKGIKAYGWYYRIQGAASLLLSSIKMSGLLYSLTIGSGRIVPIFPEMLPFPTRSPIVAIFGNLVFIAISFLILIISNGVIRLKEKMRKWVIYLAIFNITLFLIAFLLAGGNLIKIFDIIKFIIDVTAIYYLTRPQVKEQFE